MRLVLRRPKENVMKKYWAPLKTSVFKDELLKNARLVSLLFITLCVSACAGAPRFSSALNKDWNLIEVRTKTAAITFDRNQLATEGFGEIFTLRFDAERVNGVGAPNRYFAPYKTANNQAIAIQTVAGTMMVPLHEPEKLKEHDFFKYLENTYKWNLVKDNFQLYTKSENGAETILIFVPSGKK
jgi:hypothetical protein